MRALFIAYGPKFKSNYKLNETFPQNCVYSLMCEVLGIEPAPNNGSLEVFKDALVNDSNSIKSYLFIFVSLINIVLQIISS